MSLLIRLEKLEQAREEIAERRLVDTDDYTVRDASPSSVASACAYADKSARTLRGS